MAVELLNIFTDIRCTIIDSITIGNNGIIIHSQSAIISQKIEIVIYYLYIDKFSERKTIFVHISCIFV